MDLVEASFFLQKSIQYSKQYFIHKLFHYTTTSYWWERALFGPCSVTQQLVIEEEKVVQHLVGKENDQALNVKKILVTLEKEDAKNLVGKENDQPLNVKKIYRTNLQT